MEFGVAQEKAQAICHFDIAAAGDSRAPGVVSRCAPHRIRGSIIGYPSIGTFTAAQKPGNTCSRPAS